MRWTPIGIDRDMIDRRGGGGGFRLGGGLGCGGIVILLVLSLITGQNFFQFFDGSGGQATPGAAPGQTAPVQETPEEQRSREFVSFVAKDAQDTWTRIFQEQGAAYERAHWSPFSGGVRSGCGGASAATGPFYCPADSTVYLDLSFFDELHQRFGAPGDFAQAYVIAHEIGHHVQNVVGTAGKVHEAMQRDRQNANEYSVRLELQADCLAGVWAHSAARRNLLEAGDVEEGLGAAAAVGDDRIQKMSGRAVSPESWTHGSSEQRMEWFQRGFQSGQMSSCDTFSSTGRW